MARNLKTGWVIVATSGPTVDGSGRVIKKSWIKQMADNYNPKVYTAMIWPDHDRDYCGGRVNALKWEHSKEEEFEGEIHLYAITAPNNSLIRANEEGQFLFSSIELKHNFMGKGFTYLGGLGATNDPASAGCHELKYSSQSSTPEQPSEFFSGHKIDYSANLETQEPNLLKRFFKKITQPNQDDDDMTPEQLAALQESLGASFDAKFSAMQLAITEAAKVAPKADDENSEKLSTEFAALKASNETLVTANTALTESNKTLEGKFTALDAKFEALLKEPDGKKTPAGDDAGGDDHPPVY